MKTRNSSTSETSALSQLHYLGLRIAVLFLICNFAFLIFCSHSLGIEDYVNNIEKGVTLYEQGYFDKAIQKFKQIISELISRPEDEARNEGLFKANLYLGMSYLGKGKESLAKESFKNALNAAPYKTLDPVLFPPKVISLYNEVISQNLSTLSVKSNVPDAGVFLDDIKKGNTPLTLHNILPGTHTVKVAAASQELIKTVTFEPGKEASIMADFQTTGSISVASEPSAATVNLDDKAVGVTPMVIKNVLLGEHTLSISKEGYIEAKEKVIVKENKILETYIKLNPASYSVKISSVPENADVFWDEASKGTTPVIIGNVTAGPHKIRVVKESYEEKVDTIDVKDPLTEKTYYLNQYTGTLTAKTDPSGAEVMIDNKSFGTTPIDISALPAKPYMVKLKKEGYREKNVAVSISKDKTTVINEILLKIDTQPPDIVFKPPTKAIKENKNFIRARITDNQEVGDVSLMLKIQGGMNFQAIKMYNPIQGIYEAVIPDLFLKKDAVLEYYINACDIQNNCRTSGSKESPYRLKVRSLEPYTEGFIIDVNTEDDTVKVTISIGSVEGVKKGDKYAVFRVGKELRDPETGELLQFEEIFVGTIKVKELMPKTAYATVYDAVMPVARNDRIRKVVSAPMDVVTEGSYATKIILRWSPNREPEVKGYRIFRSSEIDRNYKKIAEIEGRDNTSYEDTDDMMEGLTYYYKISAFNIFDIDSMMSEPIVGKTKRAGAPPEDIRVDGIGIREVRLTWSIRNQDPDTKRYIIYRADSETGQFVKIEEVDGETNSYTDRENLKDGKTYYYKIASKSRHGSIGEQSTAVMAKTKERPLPPGKINAVSGMTRMVKVQWDRHIDPDVTGYIVYRSEKESGPFTKIGKTEKTEFLDKELSDGKTYYYTVSSYYYVRDMEVLGSTSKPVYAETKPRPETPSGVSAESGLARKVNLKWNKNEEKDIVEYWVYKGLEGRLDNSPLIKIKANLNTFTDTGLKDNTKYSYAIKAVDADGLESDLSNIVSAVTKTLPKAPVGLKGRAAQGKIFLTWEPNKELDIKGYNVYRKSWFKSTLLTTSDRNSCKIKIEDKTSSVKLYITAIDKDDLESEPSEEIEINVQ